MESKNVLVLGAVAVALLGTAWFFVSFFPVDESGNMSPFGLGRITNFEECAAAGYPVMESYPRQCNTPDGGHFVEKIGESLSEDIFSYDIKGCVRAGCSAELCVDAGAEGIGTTCVYLPEYACYMWSKCERQKDGRCGWTQTPELQQCLTNPAGGDWMPHSI